MNTFLAATEILLKLNGEFVLEQSCCKKWQKKETGLGNRGSLKVLNDSKLILND